MGNFASDFNDPRPKSLKSFKDIKLDINNLNEIFRFPDYLLLSINISPSNDDFIYEFGCHLTVRLKSSPKRFLAVVQYRLVKEVDFEVEMVHYFLFFWTLSERK